MIGCTLENGSRSGRLVERFTVYFRATLRGQLWECGPYFCLCILRPFCAAQPRPRSQPKVESVVQRVAGSRAPGMACPSARCLSTPFAPGASPTIARRLARPANRTGARTACTPHVPLLIVPGTCVVRSRPTACHGMRHGPSSDAARDRADDRVHCPWIAAKQWRG